MESPNDIIQSATEPTYVGADVIQPGMERPRYQPEEVSGEKAALASSMYELTSCCDTTWDGTTEVPT